MPLNDTILVAAPPCTAIRHIITGVLAPYRTKLWNGELKGIQIDSWGMTSKGSSVADGSWGYVDSKATDVVEQYQARITTSAASVAWIEYLLLRSGRVQVLSRLKNPQNEAWASTHGNVMPKPWTNEPCEHAKARAKQANKQAVKPKAKNWLDWFKI